MGAQLRTSSGRLLDLLRRQHCVASRRQLLALGFSRREIAHRIETGEFRPLHRGVYLVGPYRPRLAREMAAVLACGQKTYLSHRSAAHLWSLTPYLPKPAPPEVTVVGRDPHPARVRVHRARSIPTRETTHYKRIPITTPARTLLDLAPALRPSDLEQAFAVAVRHRLTTAPKLTSLLAQHPRARGRRKLIALLEADEEPAFSRSRAEQRFLDLIRQAELPPPEVNAPLGPYEINFLWPTERLAVEFDSWRHHGDRTAFEWDRTRDADLAAWDFRVIRVTWRQLEQGPARVIARVATVLARPTTPPS